MYKLREIRKEDLEIINTWRNDEQLVDYLGATFRYINLDVDNDWYFNYMQNRNSNVRCSIINIDTNEYVIGLVSLTNINHLNQSAEFHIMIGNPDNRGRGAGYFAVMEMLRHAFSNLNLNRVELTVLDTNLNAIKLYNKVGFKTEGLKRECVYKNGKLQNVLMMSILKHDFLE